jgi:hypothetical protein
MDEQPGHNDIPADYNTYENVLCLRFLVKVAIEPIAC